MFMYTPYITIFSFAGLGKYRFRMTLEPITGNFLNIFCFKQMSMQQMQHSSSQQQQDPLQSQQVQQVVLLQHNDVIIRIPCNDN